MDPVVLQRPDRDAETTDYFVSQDQTIELPAGSHQEQGQDPEPDGTAPEDRDLYLIHHAWHWNDHWGFFYELLPTDEEIQACNTIPVPTFPRSISREQAIARGLLPNLDLRPDTRVMYARAPVRTHKRGIALGKMDAEVARRLKYRAGEAASRKYPRGSGGGPRSSRRRFWCPTHDKVGASCYAAIEAERLHSLDWHTVVVLKAPDWATFAHWWARTAILTRLDGLQRTPYYIGCLAIGPTKGTLHAHLVIGGGNRDRVRGILDSWPGYAEVKDCYAPFGAIHYALAQTTAPKIAGESKREYWHRVKTQHAKRWPEYQDGILQYIDSGQNLEIAARVLKAQIQRTRKAKRQAREATR